MTVQAMVTRHIFYVNEPCSVEIVVISSQDLVPGDSVEFQFPNSWSLVTGPSYTREFQTLDPSKEHYISVSAPGSDAEFKMEIRKRHLNFPEGAVRHGRLFMATLVSGKVSAGQKLLIRYEYTFAPNVAEVETIWLRVKGLAPEIAPVLRVMPGPHETLRLIVPSGVEPGEMSDVLIASLDEFENASNTSFDGESLFLADGTVVATGISFEGSTRVPVSLEKSGVYRFKMLKTVSNAVRVGKNCHGPYWGDIHIHTKLSHDGQGTDPYKYARDVSGLDFACVTDHWESLGEEGYRLLESWTEETNEPGRFVTLLGDERNPSGLTGHHNIYFRDIETFRKNIALPGKGSKTSVEEEMHYLKGLDPSDTILIPHHTGICFGDLSETTIGSSVNWEAWNDMGLRPVMEIYSHHGQSEVYAPYHILAYEFNRMHNRERRTNSSLPGHYYAQDYWQNGAKIGAIASSDDHNGKGGRRHGGITAVYATNLTREGIFDALRQRHCYATTGERILIEFSIDGVNMGDSVQRQKGKSVTVSLKVWGTDVLLRVDILRFRFGVDFCFKPILSTAPRPESMEAFYDVQDTLTASCMYYARIVQEPLEWPGMVWTSPIWIDVR